MSFTSTSWVWDQSESTGGFPPIIIERCRQRSGVCLYAVRQSGACMSADGLWMYEPTPSSRDEDFLRVYRFATWDSAAKAIERHCKPAGRFQLQYKAARAAGGGDE